ncbi:hypothetical protein [Streptomyces sp. NPDC085529]|uniref:hypothetical protein n=1 Tax=Streptomyces sp. NPDC085529 TaxID=3365729 RepID=UPI0037CDF948
MDRRHDPERTQGIRTAELTRPPDPGGSGTGVGAEVTRTVSFLGRRIAYVLRVAAHDPPRLLDMVSVAGPMPTHVTYTFDPAPGGGTRARIHVRDASGLYGLAAPLMARKVRSSSVRDLRDLELRLGAPVTARGRDRADAIAAGAGPGRAV